MTDILKMLQQKSNWNLQKFKNRFYAEVSCVNSRVLSSSKAMLNIMSYLISGNYLVKIYRQKPNFILLRQVKIESQKTYTFECIKQWNIHVFFIMINGKMAFDSWKQGAIVDKHMIAVVFCIERWHIHVIHIMLVSMRYLVQK